LTIQLSQGEPVNLSELDFDAFEPEDVGSLNTLYLDVFEKNAYATDCIASVLRKAAPVCKHAVYV